MEQGTFSVEQANKMLPLVSRIASDLVKYHARWLELLAACDTLLAANTEDGAMQAGALQGEIQQTAADIDRFLRELRALGVEFKGFDTGLLDFPSRRDGRDIFLCWQLGESRVEHWHEIDAGFAGRQLLIG